jgi:hypothetical protein
MSLTYEQNVTLTESTVVRHFRAIHIAGKTCSQRPYFDSHPQDTRSGSHFEFTGF